MSKPDNKANEQLQSHQEERFGRKARLMSDLSNSVIHPRTSDTEEKEVKLKYTSGRRP